MLPYYLILLLILGLAYPLCIRKPGNWKPALYLALVFGYLWFLATFRVNIGFDYQVYIDIFQRVKEAPNLSAVLAMEFEPGFLLLTWLMGKFIGSSVAMYGVYELLVLAPVAWFIYRYCREHVWLSAWLYITLTFFYTSMNFVRQSLAASIILLGYRFLRDKKYLPFLAIALLAVSFHKTAVIMLPVCVVCHLRLGKRLAAAYAAATALLYLTSPLILDFITSYIFTSYKDSIYISTEHGFPLIFLVLPLAIFAACLALRFVWEKRKPESGMLLNLMLYNTIIWLFITRHFILERFSMYVYIFVLLALPQALSCLRRPQEEYEKAAELAREAKGAQKAQPKERQASLKALTQTIKDHEKYYWSAVVAALLLTLIYNDFGANVNGFHNVFPYQSVIPWMNF